MENKKQFFHLLFSKPLSIFRQPSSYTGMRKRILKLIADIIIIILVGAGTFYVISWYGFQKEDENVKFGVTFSTVMSRQLGLEPRKVFDALVEDLGVKIIRLPVYWTDIEKNNGEYDFSDYDYFIGKAERKGVRLILAVGRKLPRWPECHVPSWAEIPNKKFEEAILNYIKTAVERYKNSPAVEMWQVENEPFHVFGDKCAKGKIGASIVDEEITLVRSLDPERPIMLTDSGEQGIWFSSLSRSDVTGVTMYRQVWNPYLKVVHFPLGPGFYWIKREFFSLFYPKKRVIVAELQAEPWGPGVLLPDYDLSIQLGLMNVDKFKENISFARRTGFDTFYLWGVEWWYWLKEVKHKPEMWNIAKGFIRSTQSR